MNQVEPNPEIGLAHEDEMPEVIDLMKRCGIYFEGEEEWLNRSRTLVARQDQRIICSISFEKISDDYYHVYGHCVDPGFRNRGLGTRMRGCFEDIIYREGARGYIGEALTEELAQLYMRKHGVRICRLSLRGWRDNLVPYRKDFVQEGIADSVKRAIRRVALYWARKKRLRKFTEVLESAVRRVKKA